MKITDLPSFETYCQNTTPGDALRFDTGTGLTLWFSYRTLVAFKTERMLRPMVTANTWGRTTGKHLNAIDDGDKANRVCRESFEAGFEYHTGNGENQ